MGGVAPWVWLGWLQLLIAGGAFSSRAADETKTSAAEKKPEPPHVLLALPLALESGLTNTLQLRGLNLTDISELKLTNGTRFTGASLIVVSSNKADVPKDYEAKRVGDTRLEARVFLPRVDSLTTNAIVVVAPGGESEPIPILILPPIAKGSLGLVQEKEPNGSFKQAQVLAPGGCVLGTISESGDVDAYRVAVRKGDELIAEIYAEAGRSMLDSLLTVYDEAGYVLAANDDRSTSRDSQVRYRAKKDGFLILTVQDANDKGGFAHLYVLSVRTGTIQGRRSGRR